MRSAERGSIQQNKEFSLRQHVRLFVDGIRLFNSPKTADYDKVSKQALLTSVTGHALSILTAPEWQHKGISRTLGRLIGEDDQTRQDAERILRMGAKTLAEDGIKSSEKMDPVQVAKWHMQVLKDFNLAPRGKGLDLAA